MGKKSSTNKLAFFTLCLIAIVYLVAMILHLVEVSSLAVTILQNVGAILLLIICGICGWNYVASKATVYKVLYIVVILVILVAIVIPMCL
ncbi:MAG: hypothetical protein MRZ86_03385 [Acidaminococcus sp.]|nr:hypothetical protein [Acidaminococcus sp.]MDD7397808.1 hypothetical protein [Bacillota bacterium]MDY5345484.1 hypothetical protein [Eubacteriales bacterium]